MVGAVDAWAAESGADVFAQVGPTTRRFVNIRQSPFLEPADFDRHFNAASLVVAHAGMGSILTALSYGKPLLVMPRRASLGEHRNEHQLATARRFASIPAVHIAWDEGELVESLRRIDALDAVHEDVLSPYAPDEFLDLLRQLIRD